MTNATKWYAQMTYASSFQIYSLYRTGNWTKIPSTWMLLMCIEMPSWHLWLWIDNGETWTDRARAHRIGSMVDVLNERGQFISQKYRIAFGWISLGRRVCVCVCVSGTTHMRKCISQNSNENLTNHINYSGCWHWTLKRSLFCMIEAMPRLKTNSRDTETQRESQFSASKINHTYEMASV